MTNILFIWVVSCLLEGSWETILIHQIMNGDVIRRIRQYKEYIGHYHTAGVPGRGELDESQEINYPAVMRAIVEAGYTGYVAQEFIPTWSDPMGALRHAVRICDV